jgi:hypothetical protein
MAVLYDARGNEYRSALDQITNGTITDARTISATLAALNAEVVMDLNGEAVAIFDVRTAAASLSLAFEGTVDGTNYVGVPAMNVATEALISTLVLTTTSAAAYQVGVTGFRRVRIRCSAYTSGNVTISSRATRADWSIYARPYPSTTVVTATAAVNTGSTATLAAPGAGLFHYITAIKLSKLYAVVGVAAGAGVIITSTNITGNPAWTTPQNATAAGGVETVIDERYMGNPLKSAVANTATTFVAGAQLQTIWRWNVFYYVGA